MFPGTHAILARVPQWCFGREARKQQTVIQSHNVCSGRARVARAHQQCRAQPTGPGLRDLQAVVCIGVIIAGGRTLLRPIYRRIADMGNADVFAALTLLVFGLDRAYMHVLLPPVARKLARAP